MRKSEQKKLALSAGFSVIPGKVIRRTRGVFCLADTITYPCFVKPNISALSMKSNIERCENEGDLRGVLGRYVAEEGDEVLVEKCAEIACEFSVLGLSVGDGVSPLYLAKALCVGSGERRGVMLAGELGLIDNGQELAQACIRLISSIGYVGIFDIDLFKLKNGDICFVELNLRPGASTFALAKVGVNLPAMFADYLLRGNPLPRSSELSFHRRNFANEKVLLEEFVSCGMTWRAMLLLESSAEVSLMRDEDDPAPFRIFCRRRLIIRALMPLRKLLAALHR